MAFPSVNFKIVDQTYIAPPVEGNTRVYIPFFSEKGIDGQIFKLYSPEQVISLFGKPNSVKYGNGLYYVLKAIEYDDVNVYGIRLTPADAKYANVTLTFNEYSETAVTDTVTNDIVIPVNDASVFAENKEIVLYEPASGKYIYRIVTNIDKDNDKITVDKPVTVDSNYVAVQIPDISLGNISSAISSYESILPGANQIVIIAKGKGNYYNYVKLNAVRNETIEEYFVDEEEFIPYMPYMFYNITVYEKKPTAAPTILENNYVVSLVDTTSDGQPVLNPTSGANMFIEEVINGSSMYVYVAIDETLKQKMVEKPFIYGKAFYNMLQSTNGVISLSGGYDGDMSPTNMKSLLIQAYNGTYNKETSQILVSEYPFKPYEVEYVVDYTGDPDVQQAVCDFAKARDDCFAIVSAPLSYTYTQDIQWRTDLLNQSQYNVTGTEGAYCDYYDPYNNRTIKLPLSFWLMDSHLYVDTVMDLTVPVAGLNGGAVRTSIKNPTYIPNIEEAKELSKYQINPLVKTADGTYFFVEQKTFYKRSSYLQRANYVKFLNKIKKDLYPRLYDLLQRKATPAIIQMARRRVEDYLSNFTVDKPTMGILEKYEVIVEFDKSTNALNVIIKLWFVGIIEEVNVTLMLMLNS